MAHIAMAVAAAAAEVSLVVAEQEVGIPVAVTSPAAMVKVGPTPTRHRR